MHLRAWEGAGWWQLRLRWSWSQIITRLTFQNFSSSRRPPRPDAHGAGREKRGNRSKEYQRPGRQGAGLRPSKAQTGKQYLLFNINSEFYWHIKYFLFFQSLERLQRMRCREHIGKSLPELWVPTIKVLINHHNCHHHHHLCHHIFCHHRKHAQNNYHTKT